MCVCVSERSSAPAMTEKQTSSIDPPVTDCVAASSVVPFSSSLGLSDGRSPCADEIQSHRSVVTSPRVARRSLPPLPRPRLATDG